MNFIHHANALSVLSSLAEGSVDMVYVDVPFGTGISQRANGMAYVDSSVGYADFLRPIIGQIHRVLKQSGTMYLHLDWRNSHRAHFICDDVSSFGEQNLLNEVIWSYNYGGRGKDRFPRKHDNILVYAKHAGSHVFNWDDIPRVPYKAPEMQRVGRSPEEAAERIARGQVPTDVWEMSIVGTASKERTGYPTQKPVKLVERAILASSPVGGLVVDVFAGSGTTGQAAMNTGRSFVLADVNPQAIEVMKHRFNGIDVTWVE